MEHIVDKNGLSYFWEKIKTKLGINSITIDVDDNVGSPSGQATLLNGVLAFVFRNLKGEKGDKGDTVLLGDGTNYTLYNSVGSNTDGAMTQWSVTELFRPLNINVQNGETTLSNGPGDNAVGFYVDAIEGYKIVVNVARQNLSGYHYRYDFYEYDANDNLVYSTITGNDNTINEYTVQRKETVRVRCGIREYDGTSMNQLRVANVTATDFTYNLQGGIVREWPTHKEWNEEMAFDLSMIKSKMFGDGDRMWLINTNWKYGYYTSAGVYNANDAMVYTYFRIKGTVGFRTNGQIVNYVDKDKKFISNLVNYSSGVTEASESNYPTNAVYICVTGTASISSRYYCELLYDGDILEQLHYDQFIPALRDGSASNSGNAYCVSTSTEYSVSRGDVVFMEVLKTIPSGCRIVTCGSGVLKFDYNQYNESNVFVVPADGSFRLGFTIFDPSNNSYIAQRVGTGGNVSDGDVRITIYRKGTVNGDIKRLLYQDAYLRNRHKDAALAAAVRYNVNGADAKDLGLLIITDSHSDPLAERNSIIVAKGFKRYVDAIIHLGDFCASKATDFNSDVFNELVNSNIPFFFAVGNHDVGNSKTKADCLTNTEAYERYIAPLIEKSYIKPGEYTEYKCYYYHDFAEYNVRLIVVYEFDDPNDTDASDNTKYKILRGMSVISEEQATWFLNTLASTPSGYNVVVAMHGPFSNYATTVDCKFTQVAGVSGGVESLKLFGTDFFADAVNAYVRRQSYTCNMVCIGDAAYLNSSGRYWTVTKDFSSAVGGFLCFIGGHRHRDYIYVHNTYKWMKQIDCVCANTNNFRNAQYSDISRTLTDSMGKDCLTFVGFDNSEKISRVVKLGVDITKSMTKRDADIIPFNTSMPLPTYKKMTVDFNNVSDLLDSLVAKVESMYSQFSDIALGTKKVVHWNSPHTDKANDLWRYYSVNTNSALSESLTPDTGYALSVVSIIMDGTDITQEAYLGGAISIPMVTGNVAINVETASQVNTNMFTRRTTADGIVLGNDKAALEGVRGNTLIYNNYVGNSASYTNIGLTITYSNRKYTISGTADTNGAFTMLPRITGVVNHKYYVYLEGTHNFYAMSIGNMGLSPSTLSPIITRCVSANNFGLYVTVKKDVTYSAELYYYLIDLTQMFGAGNEPTTAAEFEKLFPKMVRPYSAAIVLNNSMTNYISKRYDAVGVAPKAYVNSTMWAPGGTGTALVPDANGVYTLTVASNNRITLRTKWNLTSPIEHSFYMRCYVKANTGNVYFMDYGGAQLNVGNVDGTFKLFSALKRVGSRPDFAIFSGVIGEEVYFKLPLYIDLTDMFGAGNEPTLAECDAIFDNLNLKSAADFDNWNILQNVAVGVPTLTGKLNGEGESVVVFPNGMKSTVCLPNVTPSFVYKSDGKASYIDLDYVPTGYDIVIKCKIRTTSYISSAQNIPWFCCDKYTYAHNEYAIFRRTNTSTAIYVMCGSNRETSIGSLSLGTDYEIEMSSTAFKINGTTTALNASYGVANTHTLKLLGGVNAYLYYFQVYKGEDLVVDCIPYRNGEVVGLQDRARDNRIFTLTQVSGEGLLYSREPTYEELPEPTFDEIKQDNGVWKAYKRISGMRVDNTVNTSRSEYAPLAQEEVYTIDDQTIPTEITVADQGGEEILPTNGATPTTAPAIMEIQYGSIPPNRLLGGGLLGGMLGGSNNADDDSEYIVSEENSNDDIIEEESLDE